MSSEAETSRSRSSSSPSEAETSRSGPSSAPSEAETSRGESFPVEPRDPSAHARDDRQTQHGAGLIRRLQRRAFAPVDNAALVFFRIGFGLILAWEVYRYFSHGWISRYWIEPQFHFTYYGFSWVKPWPGNGMYIHWGLLGVLATFVAAGFLYRLSITLFFLAFTYSFLLDQALYLNHLYLVCLFSFLLIFMPANRAGSVDAWLRPRIRGDTTPAWTMWLLRLQMGVVYFYGGIAKLSPDWLRGEPMRSWMARNTNMPVIGRFFDQEWAVYTITYGGLLLDLLIVPALLWRRTRIPAFAVAVLFHVTNAYLFRIGIFPWLAIAATTLFFAPDWPRRLIRRFRGQNAATASVVPQSLQPRYPAVVLSLIAAYAAVQLLVPLRHLLYPGSAAWTYEGHRFSWRMKLHDRDARARFYVIDENVNRTMEVNPRMFLTRMQTLVMAARPDMLVQFAHFLADKLPRRGPKPLRVEARVLCSLNGRKPQLFIDQNVNLAAERRTLRPTPWILPLTEPLPQPGTQRKSRPAPADTDETAGQ